MGWGVKPGLGQKQGACVGFGASRGAVKVRGLQRIIVQQHLPRLCTSRDAAMLLHAAMHGESSCSTKANMWLMSVACMEAWHVDLGTVTSVVVPPFCICCCPLHRGPNPGSRISPAACAGFGRAGLDACMGSHPQGCMVHRVMRRADRLVGSCRHLPVQRKAHGGR